jgi:hypothetical protein
MFNKSAYANLKIWVFKLSLEHNQYWSWYHIWQIIQEVQSSNRKGTMTIRFQSIAEAAQSVCIILYWRDN